MPQQTFTLDTSNFDKAMRRIAAFTGRDFRDVVKNEAHAILKKSVLKTGAADAKNITAHYNYTGDVVTPKSVIPFVRLNGRKVRVRSIKKKGMFVTNRKTGVSFWDVEKTNPDFRLLRRELKRRTEYAKARRGQSKATWVYIAKRLGLKSVTNAAYVLKAYGLLPNSLKSKLNGREHGQRKYYVEIRNSGRTAMVSKSKKGPGGYRVFLEAFKGRRDYFYKNLDVGAFKTVERALKKYPGLLVEKRG